MILGAKVRELTLQQWALSGLPIPTYARYEMPIRIIRGPKLMSPPIPEDFVDFLSCSAGVGHAWVLLP